jgi:hypothetical protein
VTTRSAGSIFWWLSLLHVLARERVAPPEQSPRVMEASVGPHGIATRAKTRTRTHSTATTDTTPRHRRAELGRSPQRPRPSRVPQPQGRDTRPHLRAPTPPGLRPQPCHRRHRPVEHRLPRMSHHGPPRSRPRTAPLALGLGTHQPHRRLHLASQHPRPRALPTPTQTTPKALVYDFSPILRPPPLEPLPGGPGQERWKGRLPQRRQSPFTRGAGGDRCPGGTVHFLV